MENKGAEIASRDNAIFKKLVKLKQKKYRKELGLCLVEGEKLIADLLESRAAKIEQIFVRKSAVEKYKQFTCQILADALFNSITDLETDPGILAIVQLPTPSPVTYPYLLLDRIADSGNMGTLLRTASAFGFKTIVCRDCVDVFSPKVLRASMGMQFMLNIISVNDLTNINLGMLITADLNGKDVSAAQAAVKKANGKYGLALGNEGNGLGDDTKHAATTVVTIPMRAGVESLNVAVAGGILMHALQPQ